MRTLRKIIFLILIIIPVTYVVLWLFSFKHYDVAYGISYSPQYSQFLGLDSKEVFDAIMSDLHPQFLRLAVPWSVVGSIEGQYDFSDVDYMVKKAGESGSKVVLVVGQKVPRWPECYIPAWAKLYSKQDRRPKLLDYVQVVVERYKGDPAVELWQVENEPFIRFPFGECAEFDKEAVNAEVDLVKSLDPIRSVVITDSGELSTWRRPSFTGDIFGTTLYRTTRAFGSQIVSYDWIPPAFYKARARLWGNDEKHFFVSELQAEPWFADGINPRTADYTNEKTFSPERFVQNVEYTHKVGASRVYLWGAEWWYFMKKEKSNSEYWNIAKKLFTN